MKKKIIVIVSVLVILLGLGTFLIFNNEHSKTSLNMTEKKWIDSNKKSLQDISIYTNVPVFSFNSEGVVFDFLTYLETSTGLEFNKLSYSIDNEPKTSLAFQQTTELQDNDILMYTDNYVLLTTNDKKYNSPKEIKNISVGVLNSNLNTINNYLYGSDITYKTFTDYNSMIESFGLEVDAVVVPKIQFLEEVLVNSNITIGYNLDEYKTYYVLRLSSDNNDSTLNSIVKKYYTKWHEEKFEKTFNNSLLNNYFMSLNNGSQSIARLKSKRYVYGFIINPPFDALDDGELTGINKEIISNFAKISGISVEYEEYNSISELVNAFNNNEIDFYFNINSDAEYKVDVYNSTSPFTEQIVVLTKNKKDITVNSIYSLKNFEVGVLKDSKVANYFKNYDISVKEYDTVKALMKDNKIDIKAIDNYSYDYYANKGIKNYHKSFVISSPFDYNFTYRNITDNKDFAKYMSFYLTFANTNLMIDAGNYNVSNINMLYIVLKATVIVLFFVALISLVGYVTYIIKHKKYRKNNLSKEAKLKYIDMLTSLKNRNYLNDNIELWDESEVYPQTIIIVDLNNIAYINDNYGHAEGDSVIKEAANVLIRTQNPNSEIIRTNGNEFLIYMVSYDEKQVVSYIKKLHKELKDLDHGFGAAIGYSIISDAIKTIDDAINEATLDMKTNKEEISKD